MDLPLYESNLLINWINWPYATRACKTITSSGFRKTFPCDEFKSFFDKFVIPIPYNKYRKGVFSAPFSSLNSLKLDDFLFRIFLWGNLLIRIDEVVKVFLDAAAFLFLVGTFNWIFQELTNSQLFLFLIPLHCF